MICSWRSRVPGSLVLLGNIDWKWCNGFGSIGGVRLRSRWCRFGLGGGSKGTGCGSVGRLCHDGVSAMHCNGSKDGQVDVIIGTARRGGTRKGH